MTKDVKGFEGLYRVNELGEVFNAKGHKLRSTKNHKTGYCQVVLRRDKRSFLKYPHRLVAEAFLPVDPHRSEVNHKDGDKQNNNVCNLEWVSRRENVRHAIRAGLSHAKPVKAISLKDPTLVYEFGSLKDASRFCGVNYSAGISNALRGITQTAHGYIWRCT